MIARITLLLALLVVVPAAPAANDSIEKRLLQFERSMGLSGRVMDKREALLMRDLELKRLGFARSAQLFSEGISPRKDVEAARAEYEKVLIELGAHKKKLAKVLHSIEQQRRAVDVLNSPGVASKDGNGKL